MQAAKGSASPLLTSSQDHDYDYTNLQDNYISTGLTHPDSVPALIHSMQQLTNQLEPLHPAQISSKRAVVAAIIAATDCTDCLTRFVQLAGLPLLDEWLQQAHRGAGESGWNVGDTACNNNNNNNNAEEVENLVLVLLSALEKLPVDLLALGACVIGRTVSCLRAHRNAEVQIKARRLVEAWKRQINAEIAKQSAGAASKNGGPRAFAAEIPVEGSCCNYLYAKLFCSNEVSETLILGSKEIITDHTLLNFSGSLVDRSNRLSPLSSSYARILSPNYRPENVLLGDPKSSREAQTRSITATNSCNDDMQMDRITDLCLCKERSGMEEEKEEAEVNYKLASVCPDIATAGIDLLATVAVNEKLSNMDHIRGDQSVKKSPKLGQVWISPTRSSSRGRGSTAIEGRGVQLAAEERGEEEENTGSWKQKSEKIEMDTVSTEEEDVLEVARQVAKEVNTEMESHMRHSSSSSASSSSSVVNQTSDRTDNIASQSRLNFDLNQEAVPTCNQGLTSSNNSSSLTAPIAILAASKGADFIPLPITPLSSNNDGWKGLAATSAFHRTEPKTRKPAFDFDLNTVAAIVGREEEDSMAIVAIGGRPLLDLNYSIISNEQALIICRSNEEGPSKKPPPLNIDLNDGPSSHVEEYHDSSLTSLGKNACMTGPSTHVNPSGVAESGRRPSLDLNAGPEECTRDELDNTQMSPLPYSRPSLPEGFWYNPHPYFHRHEINHRGMESPFKRKEPPGGAWPPVQGQHRAFNLPTWH